MTTPVLRLFAALTLLAGGAAAQQGTALYPFHEDFEAGALEAWWTSGGDGTEPVLLSQVQEPFDGSQHLNVGGIFGEGSQSAWVQLEIDLAQRSGVLIDFRMRRQKPGVGSDEGLYLGTDEGSLKLAWEPDPFGTTTVYERYVLDLDQLASDLQLQLVDGFLIRYHFSGYNPGLGGGLFFDDFRVVPKGFHDLGTFGSHQATGLGNFGASIAAVGDLSGDGLPEFAVGHPGYSLKRGRIELRDGATFAPAGTIQKGIFGERMGEAMAPIADLDGDGKQELLVGAPSNDVKGTDAGAVYVVSPKLQTILDELHGTQAGEAFGTSLAWIADVDGDTVDDFLVGSPPADGAGGVDAGWATLYSGADRTALRTFHGHMANSRLGTSLAGGPDLDGDDVPEVLVGSPGWVSGTGQRVGLVEAYSTVTGLVVRAFPGKVDGERFGASLAVVPDLDGDGVDDLVVGAPDALGGRGEARALSSLTGAELAVFQGDLKDDHLGSSVTLVGNLDGLGTDDLAIGAVSDTVGSALLVTLPSLDVLVRASVIEANTGFGAAFADLGDRDGDGMDEVLCAEGVYDTLSAQEAGQVRVIQPESPPSLVQVQGVHCTLAGDVLLKGSGLSTTSQVLVDGVPVAFQKASPVELLVPVTPEVPGGFRDVTVLTDQATIEFPGGIGRYPAVGMPDEVGLGAPLTVRFDNGEPGSYVLAFSGMSYDQPAPFEAWGWFHGLELNGVWIFGGGILSPGDTERLHAVTGPSDPFFLGHPFHVQAWAWQADLGLVGFSNMATTTVVP